MNKKGMTLTLLVESESLNYGEGLGNVTTLKKILRNGGESYTYISRQALVYDIKRIMGIDNTPLGLDGSVIQFAYDSTIENNPELDLFGYMKTIKPAKTRAAVVRVSNGVSVEQFNLDTDFLTNKGLLDRYNLSAEEKKDGGNISQSEIHKSFYTYTICVDLDKVGIDVNDNIEINNEEKAQRIIDLLKAVKFLYRDIKGRRENLSPIFVVGGLYEIKTPFFENRVKMIKGSIDTKIIKDTMELDNSILENTNIGFIEGIFANDDELKRELNALSMKELFEKLENEVIEYYKTN